MVSEPVTISISTLKSTSRIKLGDIVDNEVIQAENSFMKTVCFWVGDKKKAKIMGMGPFICIVIDSNEAVRYRHR